MASQRNLAVFILIAILLAGGHQWMVIESSAADSAASHRSWGFTWTDGSLGHLWSGSRSGRKSAADAHHLIDDSDDIDMLFDSSNRPQSWGESSSPSPSRPAAFSYLPPTSPRPLTNLLKHAPGWTMFENIYLCNETFYVITTDRSKWPELYMMISTSLEAVNSPENIRMRLPTSKQLTFVTPAEAEALWGDRIWEVKDWTFMTYDPPQFISHYYHFVAETFFGLWMMYASLDPRIDGYGRTTLAPPARMMFPYAEGNQWRDYSRFTHWFLHGVFPSLSIESQSDWLDRASMTIGSGQDSRKAFRFNNLLLQDRSATFRGPICPTDTNRIASEVYVNVKDTLSRNWWEPVRRAVLRFSNVPKDVMDLQVQWEGQWTPKIDATVADPAASVVSKRLPIVISYIVRSGHRRTLRTEDHQKLVDALTSLCKRKRWELNIVYAELLSREEQVQVAAKTTIMLGVHGNGLTHLVWMPSTPISAVIEIYYPGGYARDYEWTSRSLGMRHYAIWNDTSFTWPDVRTVAYPDGFHADQIPVYAPTVTKLIEDRVEGRV